MYQLMEESQILENEKAPGIFNLLPVPLSNVPFHDNTPAITRYFADLRGSGHLITVRIN
jgi:hypothetical protein